MSLEYQIEGQTYRVAVDGPIEGPCTVSLVAVDANGQDGETTRLDAQLVPLEASTYLFIVNGEHYLAHAVSGSDATHAALAGQTFAVLPPDQLEQLRRRGGGADPHQHVTPPMPGQVITILVEAGDRVEAGQTVVVISAMKMESNLAAPHAGTITAIHTSVGAQVAPGDILVDIEEDGA